VKVGSLAMIVLLVALAMMTFFAVFFFSDWAKERFEQRQEQVVEDPFVNR
jgi:flagellar basal body-associated protein FliL